MSRTKQEFPQNEIFELLIPLNATKGSILKTYSLRHYSQKHFFFWIFLFSAFMKFFTTILFFALSCSVVFSELETKIDSLFSEFNNSPGAAVGVYSDGKTIFKKGYRIANLDYDIKIRSKTVFDIVSVSKQFYCCLYCHFRK